MEAHVCVLLTALDLLEKNLNVHVVVDVVVDLCWIGKCCLLSNLFVCRKFGFKQMEPAGAILTTSESILFCILGGR